MGLIYKIMEFPSDIKSWQAEHVKAFLESKEEKAFYTQEDINSIYEKKLNGNSFLLLTHEKLTNRFNMDYNAAESIMELIDQLQDYSYGKKVDVLNFQVDRMSISSSSPSVQSITSDSTRKEKSRVSLQNLFSDNFIMPRTPFFYYRESDAGSIYYASRIKKVDENGHIFITPSIPGKTSFESLRDFETWIVSEYNKNNNLRGTKKAVMSSNATQYFFIGTSISNLKK